MGSKYYLFQRRILRTGEEGTPKAQEAYYNYIYLYIIVSF